jgi:hypothetical protein
VPTHGSIQNGIRLPSGVNDLLLLISPHKVRVRVLRTWAVTASGSPSTDCGIESLWRLTTTDVQQYEPMARVLMATMCTPTSQTQRLSYRIEPRNTGLEPILAHLGAELGSPYGCAGTAIFGLKLHFIDNRSMLNKRKQFSCSLPPKRKRMSSAL